jgi:hypothetical protein
MSLKLEYICISLFLIFSTLSAKYLYVDEQDGSIICTGDMTSKCKTIASALKQASSNDTIFLFPGLYSGLGNENLNNSLSSPNVIGLTIIGAASTQVTVSCKFDYGFAQSHDSYIVGIINMTVSNCTIYDDIVISRGGALSLTDNPIIIRNCYFEMCGATLGGAIYASDSNIFMYSSHFSNNFAGVAGGAIFLNGGSVIAEQTSFADNFVIGVSFTTPNSDSLVEDTAGRGGGMTITNANRVSLENCSFYHNEAKLSGGGIHVGYSVAVDITNSSFHSNSAIGTGVCGRNNACEVRGGAFFATNSIVTIMESTFSDNIAVTSSLNEVSAALCLAINILFIHSYL